VLCIKTGPTTISMQIGGVGQEDRDAACGEGIEMYGWMV